MSRTVQFGTWKVKMQYAIIKLYDDNRFKFVTRIEYCPRKEFFMESGKKAKLFDVRKYAEEVCCGMNINGHCCFVVEVPEFFTEEQLKNDDFDKKEVDKK